MAYAIFSTSQQLPDLLKQNEFWIKMFAYSHAMINPIIYITFNENFKKSFKKFLCCSNEVIPYEYSRNCEYLVTTCYTAVDHILPACKL